MRRIQVLHFTKIINRFDFIDVIIRHADSNQFYMMAATYRDFSHIQSPGYAEAGIPHFSLRIDHGWYQLFLGAWRLSRIIRNKKVDILHTHHFYESIIGSIACLLNPKTKHIVGRHYHNQFYITTKGFKLRYYLFTEYLVNALSKAIIVPSNEIVKLLVLQKVNSEKIHYIPYGFEFENKRYNPVSGEESQMLRKEMGWDGKFVIGNIGRHHMIKGLNYLLLAFAKINMENNDSLLVLIGDGPEHQSLRKQAEELKISHAIQFLGWRRDAHYLLNGIDVVVHPSLQEAFPQIMIESMALAKPLIITPVSGQLMW